MENFKQYCELYTRGLTNDEDEPLKIVHEKISDRWEVAVTVSSNNFQQISFVNGIATTKVGTLSPAA